MTMLADRVDAVIGVDTHKHTHMAVALSANGGCLGSLKLDAKRSGYLELMRWAEGGSCRHDAILRYFGDEAETLSGCGHCDVCEGLSSDGASGDPETVTLVVRKALSAVARIHERFGLTAGVLLQVRLHSHRLPRKALHNRQSARLAESA